MLNTGFPIRTGTLHYGFRAAAFQQSCPQSFQLLYTRAESPNLTDRLPVRQSNPNANCQKLLSHIDSRTFLDFDFQYRFSFRRETDALIISICLKGLRASIGGSFVVGQTTFLTGWFPPLIERPFLFVDPILKEQPSCSQALPFHPRGWPARAMTLSYASLLCGAFGESPTPLVFMSTRFLEVACATDRGSEKLPGAVPHRDQRCQFLRRQFPAGVAGENRTFE